MGRKNVTWMLGNDTVPSETCCPKCGERRIDWLIWVEEGERVECRNYLHVYQPYTPREPVPQDSAKPLDFPGV